MSDQRWLDGAQDPVEIELRRALDDARTRTGDDVSARRVWAKLVQATSPLADLPHAPRWRWFVGGAASGVLAAAMLAIFVWPARAPGPVASAPIATVSIVKTAGAPRASIPVHLGAPAPVPVAPAVAQARAQARTIVGPTLVHATANETLALSLPGGVAVTVAPGAVLSLDDKQRPSVDRGEVTFSVPHQPPGETFVVVAGPYQVVVIGTRFRVRNSDRISVDVEEGVVEVRRGAQRLARLAVGESWSGGLSIAPPVAVASPGRAPVSVARTASKVARSTGKAARRERGASKSKVVLAVATARPRPAPSEGQGSDAEEALAAGDVGRGLELYRAILLRGGPAGENAAYEIGKILRDRLQQPEAAVAAWRRYRSAHADGLLRVETDVSIVETLVRLGDNDGALHESLAFLRNHPASERRAEIARIAGDLQREAGDCRAALASYELVRVAQTWRADIAQAASLGRAACLKLTARPVVDLQNSSE